MTGYALGDRVEFTWTLHRRDDPTVEWPAWRKYWAPERFVGDPEPEPRTGFVIGKRTLSNGSNSNVYEGPVTYTAEDHFTAYLVAYDLYRKPVLVLPEHMTPMPDDVVPLYGETP